jgi:hypothetical protein
MKVILMTHSQVVIREIADATDVHVHDDGDIDVVVAGQEAPIHYDAINYGYVTVKKL